MKKRIHWLPSLLIALLLLSACGNTAADKIARQSEPAETPVPVYTATPAPTPEPTEAPTPEPVFEEYDINLMAVGDNLMHMGIVATGKQGDGTYNYDILFEGISEYLNTADIKIINQETILGGNSLGFSGFPKFNSPTEVGDAIAAAGFNVVTHATNHAADQGKKGLLNCIDFWSQYEEVLLCGIKTEEMPDIPILEIKGFKFAVLNYTYGPNLETLPSEVKPYLKMLCNYNEKTGAIDFTTLHPQVLEDIKTAKELADIVIVAPHWGTEYQTKASSYQQKFAMEMTEAGADVIIGTHPHVVQPVEWITAENGNTCLCYYSIGNYVSTQKDTISMLEGMAWITFRVTEEGIAIQKDSTGVLPLICHYKSGPVRFERVYPLADYTEELAARHGIIQYGGHTLVLSDILQRSEEIFGDMILTPYIILGN